MCDATPVRAALTLAKVVFWAALGLSAAAAVAALTVVGAPYAAGIMAASALSYFATGIALGLVNRPLSTFCACAGTSCTSLCDTFRSTLGDLMRMVAALALAAVLAAATGGWLPVALGAALAIVALGGVALTYFAKLEGMLDALKSCADRSHPAPPPTPIPPRPSPGPKPYPK